MEVKKRGQVGLGSLQSIAIVVVIAVITLAMGAKVLSNIGDGLTGAAKNATDYGLTTMNVITSNLPTVGLIVVIVIVLGLLAFLGGRRR